MKGSERARFELNVADLVLKHIDKLKAPGALQLKDRREAINKIREQSCEIILESSKFFRPISSRKARSIKAQGETTNGSAALGSITIRIPA